MKYILFIVALIFGVPSMAGMIALSVKMKHLIFSVLIVSFLFGSFVSINLVSMEHYRGPVRGYEVTLADLIALGLILGMLFKNGSKIVLIPRFFWIFLAFFLFSVFNVLQSDYSIYGWFVIWQMFRMGMIYWTVFNFLATEDYSQDAVKALMTGYIFSGGILLAITFKQKYLDGIYRAFAFFDHSNTIPSFALIYLTLLLVWALYEERNTLLVHMAALAAVMGTTFAVFSTGSRTGMITTAGAFAAAVGLANFFTGRIKRGSRGKRRTRFASIIIIVGMLIGFLMVLDTLIDRFLNAPESSEEARVEFEISAEMMADDNQWGVGLNQFSHILTVDQRYREHFVAMANETEGGVAHHIYLLTAAEMGWTGMYIFIGLIALIEFSMIFYGIGMKSIEQRMLLATTVGIGILFAIGLFEWALRQSPVLYQFAAATGFGQAMIQSVKNEKKRSQNPKP